MAAEKERDRLRLSHAVPKISRDLYPVATTAATLGENFTKEKTKNPKKNSLRRFDYTRGAWSLALQYS